MYRQLIDLFWLINFKKLKKSMYKVNCASSETLCDNSHTVLKYF